MKLKGKLLKYFGIAGLKETSAYELDGSGSDTPDTPTPPTPAGGTEDTPYTVDQVLSLGNPGTSAWTEGYIVGWTDNGTFNAHFDAVDANVANLLLAASATETDPDKCVPVQLKSGSEIRAQLNLLDNPGNLGKKIKIEGKLQLYFNRAGIKEASAYKML